MTEANYDFGDEHKVVAPANVIAEISKMVDEAGELEDDIAEQAAALKHSQALYEKLTTRDIPAKMELCGIKEITTSQGYKVKLEKNLFASIPSATAINKERDKQRRAALIKRRNDAIQWLEDNGHGDIVKREITIELGKGENELAQIIKDTVSACMEDSDCDAHVDESIQVHHKTLASLVSELREQSKVIPEDLLGVHEPCYARVSR